MYVCMHVTKFSPHFIKKQLFIELTKRRADFDHLVHRRLLIWQNDSMSLKHTVMITLTLISKKW